MDANEGDAVMDLVQKHADMLCEHFESVQIFCTKSSDDGTGETMSFITGSGNRYANYGLVRLWMIREDQRIKDTQPMRDTQGEEEDEE